MAKKAKSVIGQLQIFEEEIERLENKIAELEDKFQSLLNIQKNHLIRVKNSEEISDDFILRGKSYHDLTPSKALRLYQNPDFNFIMIDVSSRGFKSNHHFPEAISMPWEEFAEHSLRIHSKTTPILIISEDGTNSILACNFLLKRGFYNCNNISGGHKFWVGSKLQEVG